MGRSVLSHVMYPRLFESLALLAAPSSSLVLFPAASLHGVAKRHLIHHQGSGKQGTRKREGRQIQEIRSYNLSSGRKACLYARFWFFFKKLTKTRIVLEEIQELQALFQVIPTVTAVTPRGHAEATGVYVVGGHDGTWKSKNKMFYSCVMI